MNQSERRLYLIRSLLDENPETRGWGIPGCAADQKRLLRGLLNVRPARSANPEFLKIQDEYLRQAIAESWPNKLDDTCARVEWDWKPQYDLDAMTRDMIEKLRAKLKK